MNIWKHPDILAAEALRHLEDALVVTRMCAFDTTSEFNSRSNGCKKGDVISFRTHGDFQVDEFTSEIAIQGISDSSRSMVIEKHLDVSVELTARELVFDLDSFSDQVIRPASYRLAEYCDLYVGTKVLQGAGLYLSPDLFANAADIAQARKHATIQQLETQRYSLLNLDLEAKLLGQTWFNQSQTRGMDGTNTLRSGEMGRAMGMDFFSAITFPEAFHASGDGTAVTDNDGGAANRIGMDVLTFGTGSGAGTAFNAGDRLKIAGVRRPVIVKTLVDAPAAGGGTIALVDPITEIIPDGAAITVVGSASTFDYMGAIFDNRSLAVAFPMLDKPGDMEVGVASHNGVSCRIVKGYDIKHKKTTMSLDLLVGAFAFDPRRITLLGETRD